MDVARDLGHTPLWVMENFTYPQLFLFYSKIKKLEFDFVELQARLVWAVANGWKKPKEISSENVDLLKSTGLFTEEK